MTNEEILVNHSAHETRIAVMQQGLVQDLQIERAALRGLVGNLYLGRVARVLPGMQSAFVDIGLERAAFLHVADLWQSRSPATEGGQTLPIEKLLFEGQSLIVQVIKDPTGTKGARLSTQISIAGRLLVYLPLDPHIGVSQRISDETDRQTLRTKLQRVIPADEKGGFIVRTLAEDASEGELRSDVEYLRLCWKQIHDEARRSRAPAPIYRELDLIQRVMRDLASENTHAIVVDSATALSAMRAFASTYMPGLVDRLRLHNSDRPLFDLRGVETEIEQALSRRVDLKSGGYLVIDQTEAMTTIDVNTGSYVGGRNFADTIFRTNLEAAHSIARQMRLRNLGGIIIVDLIDMDDPAHGSAVLTELRKAVERDRTRVTVNGLTSLGLVEITRKRTRESLTRQLCEPCPTCSGRGQIKTARSVCYEILREIRREASQFSPREFRIVASQAVIDLLLEEEAGSLAALCDAIGRQISLHVETIYAQEQYDIVLL